VLFCDLMDSTTLSRWLDPEDYREVVRAYQAACAEVIQRFDGHIAQYLGDGLLVYFGYPLAHEDDAQRAVRAGLETIAAVETLNRRLERDRGLRLAVRVGVHTGLVVVGEIGAAGRHEQLALGETPNIAARLQGLAAPNTLIISAFSQHLVQGYFVCHALGVQTLKGVDTPLQVYQVLGESAAQSRLDVASPRGLTPLVGRDAEVALLLDRWAQVTEGLGQVMLLSGEGGIGKSRLVQVLKEHVASAPHARFECRCSPYHTNSALYPVIDLWQRALRFAPDDTPGDKLHKLEQALAPSRLPLAETVPFFAALLSLPLPDDRYAPLMLTPQRQKQKTLEALLALLVERAAQAPVLFIVEDLHWVDPSTLEFLGLLVDQGPTARICVLCTFRPQFTPPWTPRAHIAQITLNRLPRPQVVRLATHVAGGKALPTEVVQQLVAKTDGVPLFIEEMTKLVLASGLLQEREAHYALTGPLPPLAIPATLQDSLMARLDQLATAKVVAQLGATLGRQFAYDLLQAVSPLDEATLQRGLRQLVDAELLYQRGVPPQATYVFKHALIQEAAYQSLLRSARQQYHHRIAQALAERFPETAETQPEMLAHHYTEAGLLAPAIPYWQQAGQRATARSAHVEAISHLTQGLELLERLPETPESLQQELTLQIALGTSLIATRGYAAPEVAQTYARARQLCHHPEDPRQLFTVLRGLLSYYFLRAELQTAHSLAEQLLALAQQAQDPVMLVAAHRAVGTTLLYLGASASAAHGHLTQGMALYAPQQHRALVFLSGEDAGVACHSVAAWTLWDLGYPEQGLTRSQEAVTMAQQSAHPLSLCFALACAAFFQQRCREGRAVQEHAEAALMLATEQGFPHWRALASILCNWALGQQGQAREALEQMSQGLTAYRATGAELLRPYFLGLLAEAYGTRGQAAAGLTVLAEALTLTDKTEERWYEPELHRCKGVLLLSLSPEYHGEAETCFQQALAVARQQQARSWELRAAMSLSRLWQQQGKRVEARALLAPIYSWFTEGFDTADLREAKALLEELA
jgi:class 3 adenylate cyclase/predicted ATPase